jgi:mono/diheme cytochrome c family protein
MRNHLLVLLTICVTGLGFNSLTGPGPGDPVPIPPGQQRKGNADSGYQYIITGDYVNSGLPIGFYRIGIGTDKRNFLRRDGLNANMRHDFNMVKAPNGVTIAVPNCLQCHAQAFEDSLIIGLGNSLADFTPIRGFDSKFATGVLETYMRANKKKREASKSFIRTGKAIGSGIFTEVRGVNPADRLTALLISHRDKNTLQWSDTASSTLPQMVIPSDVPAWWLLKKKNAMFYSGFGRGDFGRFLMGAILLTVDDTVHANKVDSHMNDVLAYINSIRPPRYPKAVDQVLADQGRFVFERSCTKCHGTYGDGWKYPNLLIPQQVIGTDSMLNNSNYQQSDMISWFNTSWFSKGDHPAKLVPFNGYIAPPLDGVWITAPYLHNGSVPTIEALLDSRKRPRYWSRDFKNPQYDYERLGWKYATHPSPDKNDRYDTTLPGYGNQGHTFGDKLTDVDRRAVIEYLKTI